MSHTHACIVVFITIIFILFYLIVKGLISPFYRASPIRKFIIFNIDVINIQVKDEPYFSQKFIFKLFLFFN